MIAQTVTAESAILSLSDKRHGAGRGVEKVGGLSRGGRLRAARSASENLADTSVIISAFLNKSLRRDFLEWRAPLAPLNAPLAPLPHTVTV